MKKNEWMKDSQNHSRSSQGLKIGIDIGNNQQFMV